MKAPSKLDWMRASREARYTDPPREEVAPVGKPAIVAPPPVVRAKADRSGAVPLLAREGDCPSCDRRRVLLNAAKKRGREK